MLDSSPVPLPPSRRPLKRSASTASLASLPTPPRTHRKHARGRSRGSCDSDSDDHALLSTDDEAPDAPRKSKKRRTGPVANDEDAFWLASAATAEAATAGSSQAASTNTTSAPTGKSHPAPLLYRRMLAQQQQQQQAEVAPVSPPPSHRRPAPVASPKRESASDTAPSPPTTPRTRSATKRAALLRDSPSNPFLATPQKATVADSASPSPIASSASPSPHTPAHHEKPTLTYVFRGVRRTYQNPLYNHAADRPLSPPPASLLPIDHPEYSPPIHCTPKLLFPTAHRNMHGKNAKKNKTAARALSPELSGDELSGDEREGAGIRPKKLDFGQAENKDDKKKDGKKAKAQRVQTLDKELKAAGDDVFL